MLFHYQGTRRRVTIYALCACCCGVLMRLTGAAHAKQTCMAIHLQYCYTIQQADIQPLTNICHVAYAHSVPCFKNGPCHRPFSAIFLSVLISNVAFVLGDSIFDDQMTAGSWLANAGRSPGLHRDSLLVLPSARWHHTNRQINTTWAPHIRLAPRVAAKIVWCNYLNIKVGTSNCSDHGMRKYGAWRCISLMATVGLG